MSTSYQPALLHFRRPDVSSCTLYVTAAVDLAVPHTQEDYRLVLIYHGHPLTKEQATKAVASWPDMPLECPRHPGEPQAEEGIGAFPGQSAPVGKGQQGGKGLLEPGTPNEGAEASAAAAAE